MITEGARQWVKTQLAGSYTYMQIGSGGDSTNPNNTTLDSPLGTRVSVTPTTSGIGALDCSYIFDGANFVGETIKEIAIFNHSTAGDMLIRVNIEGIGPITSNESIEMTLTVEVD